MKHLLNDISAPELKEKLDAGVDITIIDVREPIEFHTFNIGGKNIPLASLTSSLPECGLSKEEEIVVLCQRGLRSETARQVMTSAGFKNVRNLSGGLIAYRRINSLNH